jgi:NADH:ubiquinone reductase (H+-translocating)
MSMSPAPTPHILVLGCGFGGLWATRALAKAGARVTVIDRTNHHLFQPLLYQVATAGLPGPSVAAPIRSILRDYKNVTVLMDEATRIDAKAKCVFFKHGAPIAYDALIVAAGATHSYFGNEQWAVHAPGLKTMDDAQDIRRRILTAFEQAERTHDTAERAALLTFVVVGGGATGVEMAGTLAEIARHTLAKEFRNINSRDANVMLLEGSPSVLAAFPEDLREKARAQLTHLGVTVRTGATVTAIDETGCALKDERIAARTIIWAAGVKASPLGASLGAPLDRAGRVVVRQDLSVPNCEHVFVVGDLAAIESDGKPVPGVSPAAKQMGTLAARNALASIRGAPTTPFHYADYGSLATIGRNAAIVSLGRLKLSGTPAWLFWLFVHIFFLIGFRNRFVVMLDWMWAYLSFHRSARIVLGSDEHSKKD